MMRTYETVNLKKDIMPSKMPNLRICLAKTDGKQTELQLDKTAIMNRNKST